MFYPNPNPNLTLNPKPNRRPNHKPYRYRDQATSSARTIGRSRKSVKRAQTLTLTLNPKP